MDVTGWIGLAVLVPGALVVLYSSRHLHSPRLSLLTPLPDEKDEFVEPQVRFTMLPYNDALINTMVWRKASVRLTNKRLIVHYRPPLWREDVVAAIITCPGVATGDPMTQTYPMMESDPDRFEVHAGDAVRVHMVPREPSALVPQWIEIECRDAAPYRRALGPAEET